jgi:hypothetical protein
MIGMRINKKVYDLIEEIINMQLWLKPKTDNKYCVILFIPEKFYAIFARENRSLDVSYVGDIYTALSFFYCTHSHSMQNEPTQYLIYI